MMNKVLCLLLSVLLLVGLMAGCSDTPKPTPTPDSSDTSSLPSNDESTTTTATATTTTSSTTTSTTVTTTVTVPLVKSVAATTEKTFESLPGEKSVLLNKNPDRGYRSKVSIKVPAPDDAEEFAKWTDEKAYDYLSGAIFDAVLGESVTVCRFYFVMENYREVETIPEHALEYMRKFMRAFEKIGVKMYLAIYYQGKKVINDKIIELKCPDADILLQHMDQYNILLHEFKDSISALNFALIGRSGEWTSASHVDDTERQAITDKMLSMIPSDMYLTMRQPIFKWAFIDKDHPRYKTVGFADDAHFGVDGVHSVNWVPGSKNWNDAMKEASYAFNDGELFTTRYFRNNGKYVSGLSVIEGLSQHRTNTFSLNHGYGDYDSSGGTIQESTFYGWKCEEVTIEWLEEKGLPYSPNWFSNKKGKKIERNVFEYLRDYIGYHFSMKDLKVTGGAKAGDTINIEANLVNYGMAAGMNLKSGFAILNEAGEVVSTVKVGNPAEWYGTNPDDYSDRELLNHALSTSMNLPKEKGTYKLAFFMNNTMGQYARLDNAIPYENGYNILHMFTID